MIDRQPTVLEAISNIADAEDCAIASERAGLPIEARSIRIATADSLRDRGIIPPVLEWLWRAGQVECITRERHDKEKS